MRRALVLALLLSSCTQDDGPGAADDGAAAARDGAAGADRELGDPTDLAGPAGGWVDPYPAPPPTNRWPAGTSDQVTPGGRTVTVSVPPGDTSAALLVVGGWVVKHLGPADGAITLALQGDGTLGPRACGGAGMSGVPHLLGAAALQDVLAAAGANLRFDHGRVFVEADGNNGGWGVEAALDPRSQAYVTGVYVPWAEYNNAPCRGVTTPASALSPRALFVSATSCDDTYCPLKSCIEQLRGRGYTVAFQDPLGPATCDCRGACPGAIGRPHFKGAGSPAPIRPWVLGLHR